MTLELLGCSEFLLAKGQNSLHLQTKTLHRLKMHITRRFPMVARVAGDDADDDLTEGEEDLSEYLSRRSVSSQASSDASSSQKRIVATSPSGSDAKSSPFIVDGPTILRPPLLSSNYPTDSAVAKRLPPTAALSRSIIPAHSRKSISTVTSSRQGSPKSIPVVPSPRDANNSGGTRRISGGKGRPPPVNVEIIDVDALPDSPVPPPQEPASASISQSANSPIFDIVSAHFPTSSLLPPGSVYSSTRSRVSCTANHEHKVAKPKRPTKKEIEAEGKRLEEQERQMNTAEFIDYLPTRYTPAERAKNPQYLKGAIILLARPKNECDSHVKKYLRMLYLAGAELVGDYQLHITHIVVPSKKDAYQNDVNTITNANDVPQRIKIVKWSWVVKCKQEGSIQRPQIDHYVHPARGNADYGITLVTNTKRKREEVEFFDDSEDEDKQSRKKKRISLSNEADTSTEDKGKESEWRKCYISAAMQSDEDESDNERIDFKYRNFQCLQKRDKVRTECPNQDVVDKLRELANTYRNRPGDDYHWRVYAYSKAIASIRNCKHRIESLEEALGIHGVGVKTAEKIMEVIRTGNLKRIRYEQDERTVIVGIFRGIYGVGTTVAYDWYSRGLRTLEDVKQRRFGIKLTAAQDIGVKYYEDLASRMPREEAKDIFDQIVTHAHSIDSKLSVEIMGSYRRGEETCGDIDILITRNPEDGVDHQTLEVLPRLLKKLHEAKILVADLGGGDVDDLEAKYMGLCRRSPRDKVRRIDILTIPYSQWPGALIYFTGDDIFNRSMRLLANKKGMSLNQRGLWTGVVRDHRTRQKTAAGTLLNLPTERAIFEYLGVPWQEPHQRVRKH